MSYRAYRFYGSVQITELTHFAQRLLSVTTQLSTGALSFMLRVVVCGLRATLLLSC